MPEYLREKHEISDGCHNRLWITVFFTMLPGAGVGETSRPRSLKSRAMIRLAVTLASIAGLLFVPPGFRRSIAHQRPDLDGSPREARAAPAFEILERIRFASCGKK